MYYKNFDLWNEKKKRVDCGPHVENIYFNEREIWWCSVGVNVGVEVDGKNHDFERPVLVIKKFNKMMFWGIPLTSRSQSYPTIMEIEHGLKFSFANLAQMRLFSTKRLLRKVDVTSQSTFNKVVMKLRSLLKINRPPSVEEGLGGRSPNEFILD